MKTLIESIEENINSNEDKASIVNEKLEAIKNNEALLKTDASRYENIDYEIYAAFEEFIDYIKCTEEGSREALQVFMMCYMSNPKLKELKTWDMTRFLDYLAETDEFFEKEDRPYIIECARYCGADDALLSKYFD